MTVSEVGYANKIDEPFRALRITGRWDRRAGAKKKGPPCTPESILSTNAD